MPGGKIDITKSSILIFAAGFIANLSRSVAKIARGRHSGGRNYLKKLETSAMSSHRRLFILRFWFFFFGTHIHPYINLTHL